MSKKDDQNVLGAFEDPCLCYQKAVKLIKDGLLHLSIKHFFVFIELIDDHNDKALAYINCGFLYLKINEYSNAKNAFSNAIELESNLNPFSYRSKGLSYRGRSESNYKFGEYKEAFKDIIKAKRMDLSGDRSNTRLKCRLIDFSGELSDGGELIGKESKYLPLKLIANKSILKYDLIRDYMNVINNDKRKDIILKLERIGKEKYNSGDFRGSIIAMRRSEKYYLKNDLLYFTNKDLRRNLL